MSIRSSSSAEALYVELQPSIYLRIALILLLSLVLLALLRTALPWVLRAVLMLAALIYGARLLRRHTGWWGAPDCSALLWDGAGWSWLRADDWRPMRLQQATLWSGLLVLSFRCARTGARRTLVLLPDSAAAHALRRLRVYLRHLPVFSD